MKKRKIVTFISLLMIVFIAACKKDTFVETVALCPQIESTNPLNAALNVPLNQEISVVFNEKMNPATITKESITLETASATIAGTVSYSGVTAVFVPSSPLMNNTTYIGRVKTTVKEPLGNALQKEYIWSFSTGSVLAPLVIATSPLDKDTNVVLDKFITATFNMPMDSSSINATTFTLKNGPNAVAGTISYDNSVAVFKPNTDLLSNTIYTATITNGVKNKAGVKLNADYIWTFTTGVFVSPTIILTDPLNNATNVVLNKSISATFSMPMDPLTINGSSFTLMQGATNIAGSVSYINSIATFNPIVNLLPATNYTATITTSVKSTLGLPMVSNYIWSFTTGNTLAPFVIITDPLNQAIAVPVNKTITATFNMPMDAATFTASSFTIKQGVNTVNGTISYAGNTVSFNPTNNLTTNSVYTATLTTAIKNTVGTSLAGNYVWSFTTIAPTPPIVITTDPADHENNVPLNKSITATFSTAMDPTTISGTTFKVQQGLNSVSGTVTYSSNVATFNPTNFLLSSSAYICTITTGAKNLAGTALAADYIWTFNTVATLGPKAPNLKTVARFGIIAGAGVSNNAGFSKINNLDVGISPGARSSVTGFPPATVNNGAIYAADDAAPIPAMLIQAKLDLTAAYLFAEGATTPAPASVSGDQGGKTLAPGIYKSTSTLLVQSGDLTLDAKGDVNAVWIFQVAAGFTTIGGAGGNIILSGGAQAKNIYWQVGSSAVVGDNTNFKGNILALTSITLNSNATVTGRILCSNGAIVLTSSNTINKP